ncbi:MAG: DUF86 domain-containing protein [Methanomicrobiales archaeon HGW-Methanomicrobiales-4]|nr:MAG: DUF86 domain-containing protein [Methanomicrobiales archaeon HGW-Methanomicrobiales-4]
MKDDKVFLLHILDEIEYLLEKSQILTYEDLHNNKDIEHAITRSLEIIGEASKNVSFEICQKYPTIPWKNIAGMRDRIIYGYFSINYEIVYDVVMHKIPVLEPKIREIISDFEKREM